MKEADDTRNTSRKGLSRQRYDAMGEWISMTVLTALIKCRSDEETGRLVRQKIAEHLVEQCPDIVITALREQGEALANKFKDASRPPAKLICMSKRATEKENSQ